MGDNLIRKGVITSALVSAGIRRPRIVGAGGTPPDQPEPWARPYVGLRWKELGRDRDGVDCWGLHRLPLLEVFGCETPLYETGYTACGPGDASDIATLIAAALNARTDGRPANPAGARTNLRWGVVAELDPHTWLTPLGAERPGDSLLLRERGEACHIGLVAGGGWMLHIEEGTDSICEPYIDSQWRRRIVGIYRHPGLVHP